MPFKIIKSASAFIDKNWSNHKKVIFAAGVCIAGFFAFANDAIDLLKPLADKLNASQGIDNPEIVVINARLTPFYPTTKIEREKDQVFLQVKLRNYGKSPVTFTSADISVLKSKTAGQGVAFTQSRCALSNDPNSNTPIEIKAGESKWITISNAIHLPGLSTWLTDAELAKITVQTPEEPFTISENFYVKDINSKFSVLFGSDSIIQATLYTGIKIQERVLPFQLSKGKDIFANDGSLQQDWFIANWKHWNPNAISFGKDCSDDS
ncbi:hypothetical protein [Pseudomonas lini]|uniref:Uncharacterized protein n=1 Tax=Pseudomonas lini TaxID=163011 RepID=A0A0J6KBP9_9PSED|nr:hypothetical protein [Pseudomonas lini]KAB0498250.1 hypothetical protein F7R14_27305 [Pseudomonas lini]KMM93457.1 hypothetical protein TU81_11735 [Pseudomonas lini]SDT54813.1 hypothetical protein SAMN04490191_5107 [Pseudomonas lini]